MKCKKCGTNNPKEYKFCEECGELLKKVTPAKKSVPGVCPSCEHKNPKEYKFCEECGVGLMAPAMPKAQAPPLAETVPETQEPTVRRLTEEQEALPVKEQTAPAVVDEAQEEEKEKKRRPLIWGVLGALGTLLVCLAAFILLPSPPPAEETILPEFFDNTWEQVVERREAAVDEGGIVGAIVEGVQDAIGGGQNGGGGEDGGGGQADPQKDTGQIIPDDEQCQTNRNDFIEDPYFDEYNEKFCNCIKKGGDGWTCCAQLAGTHWSDTVAGKHIRDGCTFNREEVENHCLKAGGRIDTPVIGIIACRYENLDQVPYRLLGPSTSSDCCQITDVSGVSYESVTGVSRHLQFDLECDDNWPISDSQSISGVVLIGKNQDERWTDVTCEPDSSSKKSVHCESDKSVEQKMSWSKVELEYDGCTWESPKFFTPEYTKGSQPSEETETESESESESACDPNDSYCSD